MAYSARFFGSITAILATCLVVGCGPKKEAKEPKKKASAGLELDFLDESGSSSGTGSSDEAVDEPYRPCGGKECGEACSVCDPLDESCAEINVLHQCTAKGECLLAPAKCG